MENSKRSIPRTWSLSSSGSFHSLKLEKERAEMGFNGVADGPPGEPVSRIIHVNAPNVNFIKNGVKTRKYNPLTFLPIFLFEMFSRSAYLYFLAQAGLAYWDTVSPLQPYGPTLALVFVLLVAAGKAILEDHKRAKEDRKMNNSIAHVVQPGGGVVDVKWRKVQVGTVLKVFDNEDIPADLMCLYCPSADNVCFIKTTNLDGESNLKIRRPVDLKELTPEDMRTASSLQATLSCEQPNPNLHYFMGKVAVNAGGEERLAAVTMNEMLLRGCTLKNSGYVLGVVVYTGAETRIQKNATKPPRKLGSYDSFLNVQIAIVIILQLIFCLIDALLSYYWRENYGKQRYYLGLTSYVEGNFRIGIVYIAILFTTMWILLSYMVPISLFVTMEVVKFIMGGYVTLDKKMRDPVTGATARARNTNIIEDLGKVSYVFSDKTGTLTSNEMRLRQIAIKGVTFGTTDFKLESHQDATKPALQEFDRRLHKAAGALVRSGLWEDGISSGGSHHDLLALHTSSPAPGHLNGWAGMQRLQAAQAEQENGLVEMDQEETNGRTENSVDLLLGDPIGAAAASPLTAEAQSAAQLQSVVLGHHLLDFWTNVCVNHSLIVEANNESDALPTYQGPSPDEVALVEGARQLGFEFRSKGKDTVTVGLLGHEATHRVLVTLEFSSERARMTTIAEAPDGTVRLYCKGSDAVMLPRLRRGTRPELLAASAANLRGFSEQGLRTLVLATRVLKQQEFREWYRRYQVAAASLDHREAKIAALANEIEVDLELLGVTAIEDKLQDGVPAAIATLIQAGMKVWMITGDKQETAINIAVSCHLITDTDTMMICNASSPEEARSLLCELLARAWLRMEGRGHLPGRGAGENRQDSPLECYIRQIEEDTKAAIRRTLDITARAAGEAGNAGEAGELVIDGQTLGYVLGSESEELLAAVAVGCSSVVVCRASPSQKAAIVRMMKKFEMRRSEGGRNRLHRWLRRVTHGMSIKVVAIGDGANDVAMIQKADIGVGILGKEGRQAANNSDFAIAQFRFLVRLLLVHGTLSDYRLARLIKYSFYKNIAFAMTLWIFQFYNGWSGQTLVDGITAAMYNTIFTAGPIGAFAICDRPVRNLDLLIKYPRLYNSDNPLSGKAFWKTGVALGMWHGALAFLIPFYAATTAGRDTTTDVYSIGKATFALLVTTVDWEIALISRYWTAFFTVVWAISLLLVPIYLAVFPLLERAFGVHDISMEGVAYQLFSSAQFWCELLLMWGAAMGLRFLERSVHWIFFPKDNMIVAEAESKPELSERLSMSTANLRGMEDLEAPPGSSPVVGNVQLSASLRGSHVAPMAAR